MPITKPIQSRDLLCTAVPGVRDFGCIAKCGASAQSKDTCDPECKSKCKLDCACNSLNSGSSSPATEETMPIAPPTLSSDLLCTAVPGVRDFGCIAKCGASAQSKDTCDP